MKTIIHRYDDGTVLATDDDKALWRGTPQSIEYSDLTVTVEEDDDTITETLSYGDYVHGKGTYTKSELGFKVIDGEWRQDPELLEATLAALREPTRSSKGTITVYDWTEI